MTRRLNVLMAAVAFTTGCATLPRAGRPSMPDVQFRMRDFRLANGMRVIVEEDHASALVGVFTVVGVGSSCDPVGRDGLAHLIEHLAFRAKPGGKMTAWNQLEAAGVGFLNAQTNFDNTTYMEVGTKDLLPKLLTIEAGRLLNPMVGVEEKIFEVEREVVRNELRQSGENAIGPAFNFLQEAAFPKNHHYSRPIGGSHESLSNISFEDAKKFAAEYYKPSNITMLVIGDVDLATIDNTLMRALPMSVWQPLPPTAAPFPPRLAATPVEPPEPPAEKLIRRNSTVASPELYVVWSLPRSFDAETVMLDFVNGAAQRALSSAFTSDPDIVNVAVFPVAGVEASMLVAQATLRKGEHVEQSYERLLDQLVQIWGSGVQARSDQENVEADREFTRRRNGALMGMTMGAENIINRGLERVESAHFTGDPLTYSRRLKALASVSDGQVSHFAEKYLQRGRARAVLVEPFPADAKGAGNGPTGLAPAGADPLTTPLPPEVVRQLGRAHTERSKNETIVTAKRDHIDEALPNGLRIVVHKRRNSLPIAVVALTFMTGSAGTTPKGAADLAQNVASPRRSKAAGSGGDFGIGWSTRIGTDRSTISGSGANGNVQNMLAQLAEQVDSMRVDPLGLDLFKTEFADYLKRTEQLPVVKAQRELEAALFKGHPFGESTLVADQVKLGPAEIEGWFERAWAPENAVLVITGDVDAEATFEYAKQWLGGWKRGKNPFPKVPPPSMRTDAPVTIVTHQPNATQAQVHMACLAEGETLTKDLANTTTATLVATTLFEKIRGELGASYGFNGRAVELVGGVQRLDWVGSIENSRLGDALVVLSNVVKNFETQTVTDRTLERARWEVARQLTLNNATAGTATGTITQQVLAGRATDKADTAFEALATIGKNELLPGWHQCRGSFIVSLVGDEAQIRDALKKASF